MFQGLWVPQSEDMWGARVIRNADVLAVRVG